MMGLFDLSVVLLFHEFRGAVMELRAVALSISVGKASLDNLWSLLLVGVFTVASGHCLVVGGVGLMIYNLGSGLLRLLLLLGLDNRLLVKENVGVIVGVGGCMSVSPIVNWDALSGSILVHVVALTFFDGLVRVIAAKGVRRTLLSDWNTGSWHVGHDWLRKVEAFVAVLLSVDILSIVNLTLNIVIGKSMPLSNHRVVLEFFNTILVSMAVAMGGWLLRLLFLVSVVTVFVAGGFFLILIISVTVSVVSDGFLYILARRLTALTGRSWLGCLFRLRNDTLGDEVELPLNLISFPLIVGVVEVAFALRREIKSLTVQITIFVIVLVAVVVVFVIVVRVFKFFIVFLILLIIIVIFID